MAKSTSRPPVRPGSQAPYVQATRQAGPERWDKPFDPEMSETDVDLILSHPIFYSTSPERFPASIPLRGVIRNDARLHQYQPGEIIVRRGDYGHSAFVIMDGAVKVLHKEPPAELLGPRPSRWPAAAPAPAAAAMSQATSGCRRSECAPENADWCSSAMTADPSTE